MKNLSYWSKANPIKARIIIGVCHVLLVMLGVYFGINAYLDDFHLSTGPSYVMISIFFIAYLLYPKRGQKEGLLKYSYSRRVKHDFILVISSIWVLSGGVNQYAFQPIQSQLSEPQVRLMITKAGVKNPSSIKKEIRKDFFRKLKEYKSEIKKQLQTMKANRQEDGNQTGVKILLIFLTVIVALGLAAAVSVLACNIACAGNEGIAWVVLLGGWFGIVWASVVIISKILKKGKTQAIPEQEKVISS